MFQINKKRNVIIGKILSLWNFWDTCADFCCKMVHCGIVDALWDLWDGSIVLPYKVNVILNVPHLCFFHVSTGSFAIQSSLFITYFSEAQSFWNFAQSMAVILPCPVQNFRMIVELKLNVQMDEFWWNLSFKISFWKDILYYSVSLLSVRPLEFKLKIMTLFKLPYYLFLVARRVSIIF